MAAINGPKDGSWSMLQRMLPVIVEWSGGVGVVGCGYESGIISGVMYVSVVVVR